MIIKVATLNLWNDCQDQQKRLDAVGDELKAISADVVVFQEVPTQLASDGKLETVQYLAKRAGFDHVVYRSYPAPEQEGLGMLSRHPLESVTASWDSDPAPINRFALRAQVQVGLAALAITNVHLAWENIAIREKQLLLLLPWMSQSATNAEHEVLLGDFNCSPDSSIHRFLAGEQSLKGQSTVGWVDLAAHYSERVGKVAPATLDPLTNPRWAGCRTLASPSRMDWILLRTREGVRYPELPVVTLFAVQPSDVPRVIFSDHSGVCAELRLPD